LACRGRRTGAGAGRRSGRCKARQNFAEQRRLAQTYEIDGGERKAVATTTSRDGKLQSRIRYELDDAGRYARGDVYGADDQLRFKTQYKYDGSGRLEEETQFTKDGALKNKLVYTYDQLTGRQTGYAVYDAAGKLLSRSNAGAPAAPAAAATRSSGKPRK